MKQRTIATLTFASFAVLGACGGQSEDTELTQGSVTGSEIPLTLHGGNGGDNRFRTQAFSGDKVQSLSIWSGTLIDALRICYSKSSGPLPGVFCSPKFGGGGGSRSD